ncbi:MAG: hypothetical protein IPJ84_08400 [Bdellovibrionales bacterium]|nr:hypothetical protein [Bdellovibrionales bacterium]
MKIVVETEVKLAILIFFICSSGLNSAQASILSGCWGGVSERSEFRYTPPGLAINIPPDIVFEYGSFRNGYMLLPMGTSPMKWYLVSEAGKGYELRFPEKSGTFNVQLPNRKSIRVRHGRKVSTNSAYAESFGKEFEEIAWGSDDAPAERLLAVPVADPNVMTAIEGELTRRIDGLAAQYHSYGGTVEHEGRIVSEATYLSTLEACREISPAIAASADRAKADIQMKNQSFPAKSHPVGGKRPTRR